MYSRHARRFAPVAAAAPALLYGSASDTSAHLSSRIGSKLYRSAVRSMTTESSSKTTQQASTVVVPKTPANKTFLAWYETHLQASPVQTKMFTGSFLWGLGDFVAQAMAGIEQYDYQRTGRAVFFGFAIHAPASHLHFNFLEWMTVRSGMTGLNIPIFKTVMEQVSSLVERMRGLSLCFFIIRSCTDSCWSSSHLVRLLVLVFQFNVSRSYGCHAGSIADTSLQTY